ncbi:MAG: diaminopimelate epimerase [Bacteroidetes bacterium]|nr:diaminopimelate epimerase [Bacteroidota bacterium]
MNLTFYKYQGAGNDFIIVDNRQNIITLTNEQVNFLCDRRFGIGADGLMLIQTKHGYDFEMIYYNADGKPGSMCGNGGRSIVQFAMDQGLKKNEYFFNAVDGDHKATVENNGWIDLKMKDVDDIKRYDVASYILDTGSPHLVKPVSDVWDVDVVKEGRDIRYNAHFREKGININFVEIDNEEAITVRTYERGVEDETLSCGTGVTASALMFAHNDNGFNRVEVKTRGGHLAVEFNKLSDNLFKDIWLCGPAIFVFKGEINID